MSAPSAQEVLMLALINRARLDPAGEAARLGIDLNEGLAAGTLSTGSRQPLAFSDALLTAAEGHSQAMIDSDFFAHTNPNTGSTPQSRGTAAGYGGSVGENISWTGTTGTIDPTSAILEQHRSLFVDANIGGRGHRLNILDDRYQEIGIGQVIGGFTFNGTTYNTSMVTQDFGIPATNGQFLTGIAYDDTDSNAFYSIGEGRGGIQIATAAGSTATGTAGAYTQQIGAGIQTVTFSGGGLATLVQIKATIAAGQNALIDLVNASTIETSVSVDEVSGVSRIVGRGTHDLVLSGAGGDDTIVGSRGNDLLSGGAGNDVLVGNAGNDTMRGGAGNDTYYVGSYGDVVDEAGASGIDKVYSTVSFNLANATRVHGDVENLVLLGTGNTIAVGNALANSITGNAGANTISGGLGNDRLDGRGGDDSLAGGSGADVLTGGAGADHFVFNTRTESTVAPAGRDVIFDFNRAQGDKIDVSGIDADTQLAGNQAFTFIGTAGFGHHAGELRYITQSGNVYLYGDVNGDGAADFSVQLNHLTTMQAGDFIL